MNLIEEVEIAYFRGFYKASLQKCSDLNLVFGKNDAGKSNIVRALSLFFNNSPDNENEYDFNIDFSDQRQKEANDSDGVRKFIYVKLTFNTPKNFEKSLGKRFYVKRQWTVSRGDEYIEEISSTIKQSQRHIVTRFLNQIRFIYVAAIKSSSIFESLLGDIYETLSFTDSFVESINKFSNSVQESTVDLFSQLPLDVAFSTKISAPSRMSELFESLDFETTVGEGDDSPRSLTLQRGDGIKARHIPELLSFISEKDKFQYHVWGFEEPENSLDFVAAEAEAKRFRRISSEVSTQIFITTHSPSFYNQRGDGISRYYISRNAEGVAEILQGKSLNNFDAAKAIGEGFYLPAVAESLERLSDHQKRIEEYELALSEKTNELLEITKPVLLTEGKTDSAILHEAWRRLHPDIECPFHIRSCDTAEPGIGGGAGGSEKLSISLKSVRADNPHVVIGLFDRDAAGYKGWELDRNFKIRDLGLELICAGNKKAYAFLLPTPDHRKSCADHGNLPIEYLFRDQDIETEIDGSRLNLVPMYASRKIGSVQKKVKIEGGIEVKEIDDNSKVKFANIVVPSLPNEAFVSFIKIFDIVEDIING